MFLNINSFNKITTIFFTIVIISGYSITAQNTQSTGTVETTQETDLVAMAMEVEFNDGNCEEFYKDEKNTYFVVNASALETKYEKIRVLELSFYNNTIVNIGMSDDKSLYLYLVNNKLDKSTEYVQNLFKEFAIQSKEELEKLNDEQLRLWLIQHDKYTKK